MYNLSSVDKNYIYILTVITIFSKFVWPIPIKKITGGEIIRAFNLTKGYLANFMEEIFAILKVLETNPTT